MSNRKSLSDFPRFTVALMRKEPPDEEGYVRFELEGKFDRVIRRSTVTWFWLLFGKGNWLCVQWKCEDAGTTSAVLSGYSKEVPDIEGATLYYLDPYWQAFHVWMVLDPDWGWRRVQFQSSDAVATEYTANETSIIDGREVKQWIQLERADRAGHSTRHYPAGNEPLLASAGSRVVPGGWDHEHCELCRAHIGSGDFGYRDSDDRWLCETCYQRYVETRDLSFVGDL